MYNQTIWIALYFFPLLPVSALCCYICFLFSQFRIQIHCLFMPFFHLPALFPAFFCCQNPCLSASYTFLYLMLISFFYQKSTAASVEKMPSVNVMPVFILSLLFFLINLMPVLLHLFSFFFRLFLFFFYFSPFICFC